MKRKEFLTKGIIGLGGVVALTSVIGSKTKHIDIATSISSDCLVSPSETRGPFPNKTPSDYMRENIIGDRKGIALLVIMTILNKKKGCGPLSNSLVDIWHCDSQGKYSEYGGGGMQREDLTKEHFLRGRQTTDKNGKVSFVSIYPGYYRGRAPHLHVEILDGTEKSLLVTQIAFPEDVCNDVYATEHYQGMDYTSNMRDGIFRNSLEKNMADSVTGNATNGYTLLKSIVVDA